MKTLKAPSRKEHFADWDFGDHIERVNAVFEPIERQVEHMETCIHEIIRDAEAQAALTTMEFYKGELMAFFKNPGEIDVSAQEEQDDEFCFSFNLHKDVFSLRDSKKISNSKSWPEYLRNLADMLEKVWDKANG